jgi:serine/threonine-protein kinase
VTDLIQIDADVPQGEVVGEYRVERKLGEGGFGTVYLATHPVIGKEVAIKVLHRRYSADPAIVTRFVAEARAVNQIRHKNIIDIFGFGKLSDGRHYYVMELLDGAPLDRLLARRERLGLAEALPILRGVARALDAAHKKGIAHRDLKPENVFLESDADGVIPKLLDFGVAKLLGPQSGAGEDNPKTETGVRIGTPHYMSPEQCRGRGVDHRTDIYAFGVLAFRILAGKLPFTGDDTMDVVLQHLQAAPPRVSAVAPSLPAAIDAPIQWMMQKDPARRPANLATAVAALEQAGRAAGLELPSHTPAPDELPVGRISLPPLVSAETKLERPSTPSASTTTLESSAGESRHPAARATRARRVIGVLLAALALGVGAFAIRWRRDVPAPPPPRPAVAPATPAPPPPAPTPTAPPPPAPAELPPTVTIEVTGTDGADVLGPNGEFLGVIPARVLLPRGDDPVSLRIRKAGFVEQVV